MLSKKKSAAGRKKLSEGEVKVPVTIWVKGKNKDKATRECASVANKYA